MHSKLSEEQVRDILASTDSQRVIARRYGIKQPAVCDIRAGRRWGHLQPGKVYQPEPLVVRVTDADIRQYDPMIQLMINNHVLRYWASGNTCGTLDHRASVGRSGYTVEDLIQQGRIWVMDQTRWLKKHRGSRARRTGPKAKESTMMFWHLRNKFISLSRSFAAGRKGGQIIGVEEHRRALQSLLDQFHLHPDMAPEEGVALVEEGLKETTKELRKLVLSKIVDETGAPKHATVGEIAVVLQHRLHEVNSVSFVDLVVGGGEEGAEHHLAWEESNPEAEYLAKEAAINNFEDLMVGVPASPRGYQAAQNKSLTS